MALTHAEGEPCTTVRAPYDAAALPGLRRQMAGELTAHGLGEDLVVDAEIVLGELAANALEHGGPLRDGGFEVAWCVVGPRLRITVRDGGAATGLRPAAFDPESRRGRGLQVVDTVCDRWTAERAEGTQVVAELLL